MRRRALILGAASLPLVSRLAFAQAAPQTEFFFRVVPPPGAPIQDPEAAFVADFNDFAVSLGFPVPFPDLIMQSVLMGVKFRIDFDPLTLDSGYHVNARLTPLPVAGADDQVAALSSALLAFFAGLPTMTNTAPAAYPDKGGQVWHVTPRGTILISPAPEFQKRYP